jgi:hypothetical protein
MQPNEERMTNLRQLHPDLWVADSPLRFFGVEVGARMTVVRLPDGKLWLHSPIAAEPEVVAEVVALGEVAYLVAPNKFHHLFVSAWQRAYPDAALYVAPGLDAKRSDLSFEAVLTNDAPEGWADILDQVAVGGVPLANEVVFFHRPSSTLILCDLAFNIGQSAPPLTRLAFKAGGSFGSLAPTHLERLMVRNQESFRAGLKQVLAWPFERVVVAHGDVCETGGREELTRGYSWALRAP